MSVLGGVGLLIGVVLVGLAVLWCVYWVSVHENKAKRKDVFTLCAIIGSQLVTIFQMQGVLQALSVIWPEPFATLVDFGALMNFRLDVLNVGCVVSVSPSHRFVGTTSSFIALILCMFVFHMLHILVRQCRDVRRARLRQFTPSLLGPVGTVFMAVFISVSSGIFEPLQCDLLPNGQSTMHAYQQVVCWNSEFGDEHQWMLMVGTLASSVPLAFLSMSLWATTTWPKRLNQGDTMFLNQFAFLFCRFHPSAHWYVLILLLRNTAFAVIPVLEDTAVELLAFSAVVLLCVVVYSSLFPWAVCTRRTTLTLESTSASC